MIDNPNPFRASTDEAPSLDQIRERLTHVLKQGGAKMAIVFGSYAHEEADRYSDLDLIIVAESDRPFFTRHEDFGGIYDVWRKGLDLLIYTPDEVSQMLSEHNSVIEFALEKGVVIYEE